MIIAIAIMWVVVVVAEMLLSIILEDCENTDWFSIDN